MTKEARRSYEAKQDTFKKKQAILADRAKHHAKDNRIAVIAGVGALGLAFALQIAYFGVGPGAVPSAEPTESVSPTPTASAPDPSIAEARSWSGEMLLNETPITFELDGVEAPQATANFISLVNSGFYDDLTCHRLTESGIFVLQCGDPNGDGSGGPDYRFGPIENAPDDGIYPAGTIAMARQGNLGDSMGSQFFIVYKDSTIPADVAGGYTVFGQLTDGLDAILEIAALGTKPDTEEPATPIVMTELSVQ